MGWGGVGGIILSMGEVWIENFSGIAPCGLFSTLCKNHLIFSSWFSRSIFRMAKKMLSFSFTTLLAKKCENAHIMHDLFHWEVDFNNSKKLMSPTKFPLFFF